MAASSCAAARSVLASQRCQQHSFAPKQRSRAAARLVVRAADAPVASDVLAELGSPAAVRKALLARGWDNAWIDGVVGEIAKQRLQTTVPQIEAAVAYLESLGIPLKSVENMASINKGILGQGAAALAAVAEYAQRQGASGPTLVSLLEAHPGLLTYSVSADGKQLEKGQARASVDVVERDGKKAAGVSYWREGASFARAPVAPYKPSAL